MQFCQLYIMLMYSWPQKHDAEVGSHFTFILHVIWHLVVFSLDVSLNSLKMLLVDLYYDLSASASSWNINTNGTSVICWYGWPAKLLMSFWYLNRQVSIEEGDAKSRESGIMFIETSAKAGFNIKVKLTSLLVTSCIFHLFKYI